MGLRPSYQVQSALHFSFWVTGPLLDKPSNTLDLLWLGNGEMVNLVFLRLKSQFEPIFRSENRLPADELADITSLYSWLLPDSGSLSLWPICQDTQPPQAGLPQFSVRRPYASWVLHLAACTQHEGAGLVLASASESIPWLTRFMSPNNLPSDTPFPHAQGGDDLRNCWE